MTFEEEFPSWSDEGTKVGSCWNLPVDGDYVQKKMSKTCLDKQRVREVVEKLRPKQIGCLEGESYDQALRNVLKELGLEE